MGTHQDKHHSYAMFSEEMVNIDSLYAHTSILPEFVSLSENIVNTPTNIPDKVTVSNAIAFYYYKKSDYAKATLFLKKLEPLQMDSIERIQYQLLNNLVKLKKEKEFNATNFLSLVDYFKSIPYTHINPLAITCYITRLRHGF